MNYTNAPNINVQAQASVKNEADINKIARKVGDITAKKTRMALSDAGANGKWTKESIDHDLSFEDVELSGFVTSINCEKGK